MSSRLGQHPDVLRARLTCVCGTHCHTVTLVYSTAEHQPQARGFHSKILAGGGGGGESADLCEGSRAGGRGAGEPGGEPLTQPEEASAWGGPRTRG